MNTQEIDQDTIIQILGVENASEEEQKELVKKALETVELRVFDRILKTLPKEEKNEFMILLEQENEAGIAQVLQKNNIDSIVLLTEELATFKEEMKQ